MFSYEQIVIGFLLAIPTAGVLIETLKRRQRLRGYGDIAHHIKAIQIAIRARMERDGADLLIRGKTSGRPVLIRLSRPEGGLGVYMRMPVARAISLFCLPKKQARRMGIIAIPLQNAGISSLFRISTDHPWEARLLMNDTVIFSELQKVCRSSQVSFAIQDAHMEATEILLPNASLSHMILNWMAAMNRIAGAIASFPGDDVEHMPPLKPRNWFRLGYALAPVLLSPILLLPRIQHAGLPQQSAPVLYSGIPNPDAARIVDVQHWRIVHPEEFDADAVSWLQQQGVEATGRIEGSFGEDPHDNVAYVLKNRDQRQQPSSRLVLLVNGSSLFDATLPEIDAVARIPKEKLASIDWQGRAPIAQPDGDGILLVQRYDDPSSAMILFPSGPRLLTGNPKDFRNLSLQ